MKSFFPCVFAEIGYSTIPTKHRAYLLPYLLLALIGISHAQNVMRNLGTQDTDVLVPKVSVANFGRSDADAINELRAHSKATRSSSWLGLTAAGSITFAGSTETEQATILMLPGNRTRLEVTTPKGKHITVTNGSSGHVQYAGGKDLWMPGLTVSAGVMPFNLPDEVLDSLPTHSVIDRGIVTITGQALHRVSIETQLPSTEILPGSPTRSTVDCYFDQQSHALVKTAAIVFVPGAGLHQFLRVTTYSNFQSSDGFSIPKNISETLDGQPTWALSLTLIDLVNIPKPESF